MTTDSVDFSIVPIVTGPANNKQSIAKQLHPCITASWQAYLNLDTTRYSKFFVPDAIRLSSTAGIRQVGRSAILNGMSAEWEWFERPNNRIAATMTVSHAEFEIQSNFALTTYWMEMTGGSLWDFEDQGLVFQVWVLQDGEWLIAHQTDSWSLDYDAEAQEPGVGDTLNFDYAFPVKELARAVKFYTPILGKPESVTATQAVFALMGARFILDTATWGGMAQVRKQLPNGYPVLLSQNLTADVERLADEQINLSTPQKIGADWVSSGLDVDGNLFLLLERTYKSQSGTAPHVSGFPTDSAVAQLAEQVLQAWAKHDEAGLMAKYTSQGTWFDDLRVRHRGQERGKGIALALPKHYWSRYDHSANGMVGKLTVQNFQVRSLGSQYLVNYDLHLVGLGAHPFQTTAWVSQVIEKNGNQLAVKHTFMVESLPRLNLAHDLDYSGAPVQDVAKARKFYKKFGFADGYADESYYGFWTDRGVFGMYEADPEEDGIPQSRKANGYLSFSVRSAKELHLYLKQNGATFPVIPAINDKSGVDAQQGYTQLVATDSEGNILLFTEYTGRSR